MMWLKHLASAKHNQWSIYDLVGNTITILNGTLWPCAALILAKPGPKRTYLSVCCPLIHRSMLIAERVTVVRKGRQA